VVMEVVKVVVYCCSSVYQIRQSATTDLCNNRF